MAMRPGKALRDHWKVMRLGNTPEAIAERFARRRAEERLRAEREARYPVITVANADEVLAWQGTRIEELTREELTK